MNSVRQAAAKLGVSPSLVYTLCRAGVIPHARHGRPGRRGRIVIADADLEAYRGSCRAGPPCPAGLVHIKPR